MKFTDYLLLCQIQHTTSMADYGPRRSNKGAVIRSSIFLAAALLLLIAAIIAR